MSHNYDEQSIQILEGLDAVRKRPGMYIGSTDSRGLHHMVWEIVDNAIDEALNGFGDTIDIVIYKDGSISIEDFGRGMPVGKHSSGKSTLEVIFTVLHAGGKFGDGGYKTSGGLHGVGASVVNALCDYLIATVNYGGQQYEMEFRDGGQKISKIKKVKKVNTTGSKVRFKPDDTIFTDTDFNYKLILEHIRESAFLLSGITFNIYDERTDKSETLHYEDGLLAFLKFLEKKNKPIHEPVHFKGVSNEGIEIDFVAQFDDGYTESTYSYVNLVRTIDGGTHESAFKSALTKAINDFARKANILKDKDKNFEGIDIREGLTSILLVSVPEHLLQFEGQTKSKLGTPEARGAVESFILEHMTYFLEENRDIATKIIEKIQLATEARSQARKAREAARKKTRGNKGEKLLSGKLSPAQRRNPKKNELYLVEGDSAGGSAKQGRDSKFQAILPLRGKVLNTERLKIADILKNEELNTIIYAIGAGVGESFIVEDSQYDKVIIMTDADTDGAHIQVLLLTFFYRFMRPLIEAGKVYIALPPLYKIYDSKKHDYIYTEDQLEEAKKDYNKFNLQRYKGLGEMNADQLWETTMAPDSRTLIRVMIDDFEVADRRFSDLMGNQPALRREWIEDNVSFTLEDEFIEEVEHE